jgi:rhamnosyltransferase
LDLASIHQNKALFMIRKNNPASTSPMHREDVCAILVTYHPDTEFPVRLKAISRQTGAVIIVDNGSADTELAMLRDIAADPAVNLVLNSENVGIARALNIGIQQAATLGYPWVLLFDQDTWVDDDLVKTLFTLYESFPDKQSLAAIGCGFRDMHRPLPECDELEPLAEQWEEVDWVITSGSLLPIAAFSDIGPFREEFFIDFVDTEYCMRARTKGYRVIKSRRPLMSHSIGRSSQHNLLGMKKWTTNHTADRRYYSARNNTVMLREYGNYSLGWWAVKGFFSCFKSYKRIILYEQMKANKMAAVFLGWWDGVQGRMGPRRK